MTKYQGYYKHTQYFKLEVEADSLEEAMDLMWDEEINWSGCCEMDNDIVDVEEIQNANIQSSLCKLLHRDC